VDGRAARGTLTADDCMIRCATVDIRPDDPTDPNIFWRHWYRITGPRPAVRPRPWRHWRSRPGQLAVIAGLALLALLAAVTALVLPAGTARGPGAVHPAPAAGVVPGPRVTVTARSGRVTVIPARPAVVITGPARFTVRTLRQPGSGQAVTAVPGAVTAGTAPGQDATATATATVTAPGQDVTSTVTAPGQDVTSTVTATVTEPGPTVTETVTATEPGPAGSP